MSRLTSKIYRWETEEKVEINIEIDSYEVYSEDDVANYISYELPKTLNRYVRDKGARNRIISTTETLFGFAVAMDTVKVYLSGSERFWDVTISRHEGNYSVKVELTKLKKE